MAAAVSRQHMLLLVLFAAVPLLVAPQTCTSKCAPGTPCNPLNETTMCYSSKCLRDIVSNSYLCSAPSCLDGVRNGVESDVDCGAQCAGLGTQKTGCGRAAMCFSGLDCQDGVCGNQISKGQLKVLCQAPSCYDRVANGRETDVDCGTTCCDAATINTCEFRCRNGYRCATDSDCLSSRCAAVPALNYTKYCAAGMVKASYPRLESRVTSSMVFLDQAKGTFQPDMFVEALSWALDVPATAMTVDALSELQRSLEIGPGAYWDVVMRNRATGAGEAALAAANVRRRRAQGEGSSSFEGVAEHSDAAPPSWRLGKTGQYVGSLGPAAVVPRGLLEQQQRNPGAGPIPYKLSPAEAAHIVGTTPSAPGVHRSAIDGSLWIDLAAPPAGVSVPERLLKAARAAAAEAAASAPAPVDGGALSAEAPRRLAASVTPSPSPYPLIPANATGQVFGVPYQPSWSFYITSTDTVGSLLVIFSIFCEPYEATLMKARLDFLLQAQLLPAGWHEERALNADYTRAEAIVDYCLQYVGEIDAYNSVITGIPCGQYINYTVLPVNYTTKAPYKDRWLNRAGVRAARLRVVRAPTFDDISQNREFVARRALRSTGWGSELPSIWEEDVEGPEWGQVVAPARRLVLAAAASRRRRLSARLGLDPDSAQEEEEQQGQGQQLAVSGPAIARQLLLARGLAATRPIPVVPPWEYPLYSPNLDLNALDRFGLADALGMRMTFTALAASTAFSLSQGLLPGATIDAALKAPTAFNVPAEVVIVDEPRGYPGFPLTQLRTFPIQPRLLILDKHGRPVNGSAARVAVVASMPAADYDGDLFVLRGANKQYVNEDGIVQYIDLQISRVARTARIYFTVAWKDPFSNTNTNFTMSSPPFTVFPPYVAPIIVIEDPGLPLLLVLSITAGCGAAVAGGIALYVRRRKAKMSVGSDADAVEVPEPVEEDHVGTYDPNIIEPPPPKKPNIFGARAPLPTVPPPIIEAKFVPVSQVAMSGVNSALAGISERMKHLDPKPVYKGSAGGGGGAGTKQGNLMAAAASAARRGGGSRVAPGGAGASVSMTSDSGAGAWATPTGAGASLVDGGSSMLTASASVASSHTLVLMAGPGRKMRQVQVNAGVSMDDAGEGDPAAVREESPPASPSRFGKSGVFGGSMASLGTAASAPPTYVDADSIYARSAMAPTVRHGVAAVDKDSPPPSHGGFKSKYKSSLIPTREPQVFKKLDED